ncbi:hypothetical protein [Massilia violaceinigra]|nr:hypothetical protein [Massilia violaceinigra]
MIFDKDMWAKIGKGFFVKDCTIGFEDGRLGLLLVEENDADHRDEAWETRLVAVKLELPVDRRFFVRTGDNLHSSTLSSAWTPNQSEFVMVDTSRRVWSYKPKEYKGSEAPIPFDSKGHHYGSAVAKVVRVGTTAYAIGSPFRIFQRIKGQQWKEIPGIPIPAAFVSGDRKKIIEAAGDSVFHDLAGFSDSDMYAVGDAGTVWHFDGKRWQQIPFPTNVPLYTVACGENGDVYITDIRGNLWKGGGSKWSLLWKMDQSLPFKDAAWFNGRLWCANDYGMYVLEGKKLVAAHAARIDPIPNEVALHSHRIDVSPDGKQMLVCGGDGAALHDGKKWTLLFSGMSLED